MLRRRSRATWVPAATWWSVPPRAGRLGRLHEAVLSTAAFPLAETFRYHQHPPAKRSVHVYTPINGRECDARRPRQWPPQCVASGRTRQAPASAAVPRSDIGCLSAAQSHRALAVERANWLVDGTTGGGSLPRGGWAAPARLSARGIDVRSRSVHVCACGWWIGGCSSHSRAGAAGLGPGFGHSCRQLWPLTAATAQG